MTRRPAVVLLALLLAVGSQAPVVGRNADARGGSAAARGRFAFTRTFDSGASFRVVVAGTDGRHARRIRALALGRPSFSPGGGRVVFSGPIGGYSTGRYGLYVAQVGGGGARRITTPRAAGDIDPAWSPDGRWILFTRDEGTLDPATCCTLYRVRPDGSRLHVLRGTRGAVQAAWAPNGHRVVYSDPGGLRTKRLDGGLARQLVPGAATHPAWSPDGRHIAYVNERARGDTRLRVYDIAARRSRTRWRVGLRLESPVWAPDSRTLFVLRFRGHGDDDRSASEVWRSAPRRPERRLFAPDRQLYGLAHTARR